MVAISALPCSKSRKCDQPRSFADLEDHDKPADDSYLVASILERSTDNSDFRDGTSSPASTLLPQCKRDLRPPAPFALPIQHPITLVFTSFAFCHSGTNLVAVDILRFCIAHYFPTMGDEKIGRGQSRDSSEFRVNSVSQPRSYGVAPLLEHIAVKE
jgi:hypothetical protein